MAVTKSRGVATARAIKSGLEKARRHATIWREEATTIVGGWRVKTTTYDDLDDDPEESEEEWAYVDSLDEPQTGDEIALGYMGDRPIVVGKIARAVSTLARITRKLQFQSNYGIEYMGATPGIAGGAGAGSGGSFQVGIEGTDHAGKALVVTGNTGVAAGVLCRITFAQALSSADYAVMLTAADTDAARVLLYIDFATLTTTYFEISCQTLPGNNTSHHILYEVIQYEA